MLNEGNQQIQNVKLRKHESIMVIDIRSYSQLLPNYSNKLRIVSKLKRDINYNHGQLAWKRKCSARQSIGSIEFSGEKTFNCRKLSYLRRITKSELANRVNVYQLVGQLRTKFLSQLRVRKLCSSLSSLFKVLPQFLTAKMRQMRKKACPKKLGVFVNTRRAHVVSYRTQKKAQGGRKIVYLC